MSIRQLFINSGSVEAANSAYTDPSLVPEGKVAFLSNTDASGGSEDITSATSEEDLLLVKGGEYPQIERIQTKNVESVNVQPYRAEVRQKTAIGYSGGDDLSTISNDVGEAAIRFVRLENGYEQFPRVSAVHYTKDGDTPYDVAASLAEQIRSIDANISGYDNRKFVLVDVLSNASTTDITQTLTVVKNSKVVVASGAVTVDVGSLIRIGDSTSDPVYKVANVDGATITLDRPYVGDNASGVAAQTGSAPDNDDLVGLIATGEPSSGGPSYNAVNTPAISFSTASDGTLDNASITSLVTRQNSSGSAHDLKVIEEDSFGDRGFYNTNYFPQKPKSSVEEGVNYDLAVITYKNQSNHNHVVSNNDYRLIYVAFPAGTGGAANIATFFGK